MDNINFASANSTFDNLNLYILSSTKEEMDARKGNFSFIMKNKKKGLSKVFFIDLNVYQKNGAEEQKRKEGLQAISFAIQVSLKCLVIFYAWHDVDFCPFNAHQEKPKNQLSTDDYENKWNHNHT